MKSSISSLARQLYGSRSECKRSALQSIELTDVETNYKLALERIKELEEQLKGQKLG